MIAVSAQDRTIHFDLLIDVVTQHQDEIRLLVGEMPVGAEISAFIIGAGGEAEAQTVGGPPGLRQGVGAADGGFMIAKAEAVPIGTRRREAADVEMDGVGEIGFGERAALPDDAAHLRIGGDFVIDQDAGTVVVARDAARHLRVRRERVWCQPGPEHEAVVTRAARRDTQGEGIGTCCERISVGAMGVVGGEISEAAAGKGKAGRDGAGGDQ